MVYPQELTKWEHTVRNSYEVRELTSLHTYLVGFEHNGIAVSC